MIASSVLPAAKTFSEQGNSQNDANAVNAPAAKSTELAPEEKKRGKRMLGVLMGTLSKFKSEEVDKSEANLKRILLEQKLTQRLHAAKEQIESVRPETREICTQFERTETLPVLYFKRAQ